MNLTKKHAPVLVALCYAVYLIWHIGAALYCFADDSLARATGKMETREMDFSTMELYEVIVESPTKASAKGEDPQFLMEVDTRVTSVMFDIKFSKNPGEVALYYAAPGEGFSKEKKIFGKPKSDGTYVFVLPRTSIGKLRVDPTNQPGLKMELRRFVLNAPRTLGSYFSVTYEDTFRFVVYPALAAAILAYVLEQIGPKRAHAAAKAVRERLRRMKRKQ